MSLKEKVPIAPQGRSSPHEDVLHKRLKLIEAEFADHKSRAKKELDQL